MKCEVCLDHLEAYLDGELPPADRARIGDHLIECADCSSMFAMLTAEQQLFERYDRELEVPPFLWTRVAQSTVYANSTPKGWHTRLVEVLAPSRALAAAIALLLIALGFGVLQWMMAPRPEKSIAGSNPKSQPVPVDVDREESIKPYDPQPEKVATAPKRKPKVKPGIASLTRNESDVLSSELAYLDPDDRDTVKHIEQSQLLLRSVRNVPVSDGEEEIDMTYDKELSRRLLNENIVLRRDAEMKAKFPTKTLLADLEPFLIDIANLPDHARAEDVQVIKERVQKTEIVAALMDYQGRARMLVNQD